MYQLRSGKQREFKELWECVESTVEVRDRGKVKSLIRTEAWRTSGHLYHIFVVKKTTVKFLSFLL